MWEDLSKFDTLNQSCSPTYHLQFVNTASGSNLRIGTDSNSRTAEIQLTNEFTLDGRRVLLVDLPGFGDTHDRGTNVWELIAAFLAIT